MTRGLRKIAVLIGASVLFYLPALTLAQASAVTAASGALTSDVTTEEVIVTGSNIPTADEVGPNPVDIYRKDDLVAFGVSSTTEFLQTLPEVTGFSVNENVSNNGDGRSEVNLRGIASKETLVLQDGRRLAPAAFVGFSFINATVDLNMLPLGLIDHIDVLKDGASAIYGSDAVAGVFNISLIHKFRGLQAYGFYSNTNLGFANDAGEERSYLLAGSGDEKTDVVVYAEVYNRAAIYSRDVNLSSSANFRRFGGADLREVFVPGTVAGFIYQPSRNGGALSPTPHAFLTPASDPQYAPLGSVPSHRRQFDYARFTEALPAVDRQYLYASLDRKLCDQYLQFFGDFKYVRSFWNTDAQAPTSLDQDVWTDSFHPFGITSDGNGISVPLRNPFNPFTTPSYVSPGGTSPLGPQVQSGAAPPGTAFTTNVAYTALEAGPRTKKVTVDNDEFNAGLKGSLGELGDWFTSWNWESAFRYNEDRREELTSGVVNAGALRVALLSTDPATAFNPFGINQNSRAVIDKIFLTTHHNAVASVTLQDLKLNGDLWTLPAGALAFAAGVEHRSEHANDTPDALTATNQIQALNFGSVKATRDVWSLYWECRVPLTSATSNVSGFYSLELGYQERLEAFSDFGTAVKPKFFLRWQPLDPALTLRATYNEAFHAPTLSDLNENITNSFSVNIFDARSPATKYPILEQFSGSKDLQPETAYEWTYGAVVSPGRWWERLQGVTMSVDFFHIDLRGVIAFPSEQFLLDHEDQIPGFIKRGASTGRNDPFGPVVLILEHELNFGHFIEEAFDYSFGYLFETSKLTGQDFGKLNFTLSGTYLSRAVLDFHSHPHNVAGHVGTGFAPDGPLPRNRADASVFYDVASGSWLAGLTAGVTVRYIGQYSDGEVEFDRPNRKIREWTTVDMSVSYAFTPHQDTPSSGVAGYTEDKTSSATSSSDASNNARSSSIPTLPSCGLHHWLDHATVSMGVKNLFDTPPPFVASSRENGYDESIANIKGRTWYVSVSTRF